MNFSYGITTSASCDTTSSISSEDQKRRSDSLDMDEMAERSIKRKKVCIGSSRSSRPSSFRSPSFRPSSPIKTHGPFPGHRQSSFVPFTPPPPSTTTQPSNHASY